MSGAIVWQNTGPGERTAMQSDGRPLWRYVFAPTTPVEESRRPYAHPVYSIDGDGLTNWRPNDHPWHHALSFTLAVVDGVNFWGGPSHRAADGYRWRSDHGEQAHREWMQDDGTTLVERVDWCDPRRDGLVLIEEERELVTELTADGWALSWTSRLHNPGTRDLRCDNYHSLGGLEGSHYSGLQFRGARGLLDQHGDGTIRLRGEEEFSDVNVLHGRPATWLEWHVQHDGSLRRTCIRFESLSGPIPWFIRPLDPLVAFAPHLNEPWWLAAGATREFGHRLHFSRA